MLAALLEQHGADCWLVNTGWSGGAYGVGKRMSIRHTRALLNAALDGSLAQVAFREEPYFGLSIPAHVPGIPDEVLDPSKAWADPAAYARTANELARRFEANFAGFAEGVGPEVRAVAIAPK